MNEIKINVNFKNKTIKKTGVELTQNDYNSAKLKFTFDDDYSDKRIVFKMKNENNEIVFLQDIVDDEIILVGYDDNNEPCSLFNTTGLYTYELSLYGSDSKLTSASDTFIIDKEQVVISDTTAQMYLPLFDSVMTELNNALLQTNNLDIDCNKLGNTATVTITKKDGSTKSVNIYDGSGGGGGGAVNSVNGKVGDVVLVTSDLDNNSGFITNSVNNLINYYLKSETYTQTEVNTLIGQIQTVSIQVVQQLPETGQSNVIYFVPKSESENDIYNEYIWVNNDWEHIGSTEVDLTGYATESWVNIQIANFLTQTQIQALITSALSNYYTKSEINTQMGNKANTSDIPTADNITAEINNDGEIEVIGIYTTDKLGRKIWEGTLAQYNAITTKSNDVYYYITDDYEASQDISNKEDKSNKVTSIDSSSTDTQYPSAKCVYDLVGNIETLLTNIDSGNGV